MESLLFKATEAVYYHARKPGSLREKILSVVPFRSYKVHDFFILRSKIRRLSLSELLKESQTVTDYLTEVQKVKFLKKVIDNPEIIF